MTDTYTFTVSSGRTLRGAAIRYDLKKYLFQSTEFFAFDTKLQVLAMLASTDFTPANESCHQ